MDEFTKWLDEQIEHESKQIEKYTKLLKDGYPPAKDRRTRSIAFVTVFTSVRRKYLELLPDQPKKHYLDDNPQTPLLGRDEWWNEDQTPCDLTVVPPGNVVNVVATTGDYKTPVIFPDDAFSPDVIQDVYEQWMITGEIDPLSSDRFDAKKRDWRNAGPQLEKEREQLEAIIVAIPGDISMKDMRIEILETMNLADNKLHLSRQLDHMSFHDTRRLLGEIRFMKQYKESDGE